MSVSGRAAEATRPRPPLATGARPRWRRNAPYLAALTPAALILALFFVFPALWAIYTSTSSLALAEIGAGDPHFVGLDNYRRLWNDPDFSKFVRNTVVFVIGAAVIGQTGLGLLLALLIHHAQERGYRLAPVAFGAALVAWIAPPALAGFIWGGILTPRDGLLNEGLDALGLGRVDMLGDYPMLSVILAEVWHGAAFAVLIFLGALQTIPHSVYEAARVDGAGAWRRLRDHTLPLIRHHAALVLAITTITAVGSFLIILILTNGDPAYQTETIALYAYHRALQFFEIGFGSAIAVVMLLLNALFAVVYLRLAGVRE